MDLILGFILKVVNNMLIRGQNLVHCTGWYTPIHYIPDGTQCCLFYLQHQKHAVSILQACQFCPVLQPKFGHFTVNISKKIPATAVYGQVLHTGFSLTEPPCNQAMTWGGCNRENHNKTQKGAYVSQKMVRFPFCKKYFKARKVLYQMQAWLTAVLLEGFLYQRE